MLKCRIVNVTMMSIDCMLTIYLRCIKPKTTYQRYFMSRGTSSQVPLLWNWKSHISLIIGCFHSGWGNASHGDLGIETEDKDDKCVM
jgi:hypothetical protein